MTAIHNAWECDTCKRPFICREKVYARLEYGICGDLEIGLMGTETEQPQTYCSKGCLVKGVAGIITEIDRFDPLGKRTSTNPEGKESFFKQNLDFMKNINLDKLL